RYGQTVMAAPPKEGFYNTLWFAPGIGMLSMALVIVLALRKWSKKNEDSSAHEEIEDDLPEDEIERNEKYYEKKLEEELRNFQCNLKA
ncbi:MAG: cytochrome c-type biogenesis protein CcmH, partial [Thermodesulfobacteriota bacterium]